MQGIFVITNSDYNILVYECQWQEMIVEIVSKWIEYEEMNIRNRVLY